MFVQNQLTFVRAVSAEIDSGAFGATETILGGTVSFNGKRQRIRKWLTCYIDCALCKWYQQIHVANTRKGTQITWITVNVSIWICTAAFMSILSVQNHYLREKLKNYFCNLWSKSYDWPSARYYLTYFVYVCILFILICIFACLACYGWLARWALAFSGNPPLYLANKFFSLF